MKLKNIILLISNFTIYWKIYEEKQCKERGVGFELKMWPFILHDWSLLLYRSTTGIESLVFKQGQGLPKGVSNRVSWVLWVDPNQSNLYFI